MDKKRIAIAVAVAILAIFCIILSLFWGGTMNKTERETIRARCGAAHRSPWQLSGFLTVTLDNGYLICDAECDEDAEFITNARQDIPALLDALEAETARFEDMKAKCDGWRLRAQQEKENGDVWRDRARSLSAKKAKEAFDSNQKARMELGRLCLNEDNTFKDTEEAYAITGMLAANDDLKADRDHWKVRAEALERALRYSAIDLCCTCLHEKTCDQKQGKECRTAGLWEFDQARFTREADNGQK